MHPRNCRFIRFLFYTASLKTAMHREKFCCNFGEYLIDAVGGDERRTCRTCRIVDMCTKYFAGNIEIFESIV